MLIQIQIRRIRVCHEGREVDLDRLTGRIIDALVLLLEDIGGADMKIIKVIDILGSGLVLDLAVEVPISLAELDEEAVSVQEVSVNNLP
jgi:hypothetical protein